MTVPMNIPASGPAAGDKTKFVRLPAPLLKRLPSDQERVGAMLQWGILLARPALAFERIGQIYASLPQRNARIVPGRAWSELEDAQRSFGLSLQLVITTSLHCAMTDRFSPYFEPMLLPELAAAADAQAEGLVQAPAVDASAGDTARPSDGTLDTAAE